jgi:hypothetical protein
MGLDFTKSDVVLQRRVFKGLLGGGEDLAVCIVKERYEAAH